jgi:hypothetical protein
MLGGTGGIMVPLRENTRYGATFLFPDISDLADATPRNMFAFAMPVHHRKDDSATPGDS